MEDMITENQRVSTVGHEKYWHHNVFGPPLKAPACSHPGCKRRAWLGDTCPEHRNERDAERGRVAEVVNP